MSRAEFSVAVSPFCFRFFFGQTYVWSSDTPFSTAFPLLGAYFHLFRQGTWRTSLASVENVDFFQIQKSSEIVQKKKQNKSAGGLTMTIVKSTLV